MRELLLVAMSENGTHLVLRAEGDDSPFALPIDERLHAAMRGDRARLGQLEIQMDSQLRPRDIQARVRAGESVESVADAAAVPLDKVLRYAGPVLAEREHIAGRARGATIRRAGGDGPATELDAAVSRWVGQAKIDPDDVVWDAWRRDDGRWQVEASWQDGSDAISARFVFDPAGRSVAPDDEQARAISGEFRREPDLPAGPARLSVVGRSVTDLPPDDDPVSVVADQAPADDVGSGDERDPADDEPTGPLPVARRPRRDPAGRNGRGERRRTAAGTDDARTDPWAQQPWTDDADSDRLRLTDIASRVEVDGPPDAEQAAAGARRPTSARSRRPTVPTWDEIMFGRRRKPD